MRAFKWIPLFAATFAVAGIVQSGCGGSGDNTAPVDSGGGGQDVTVDQGGGQDTGADVAQDSGGDDACDNDADLESLPVPDASLDSGVNIGECVNCMKTKCKTQLDNCNADCTCKDGILNAIPCIQQNGLSQQCAGGLLGDNAAQALGLCLITNCNSECGASKFLDGGKEGGNESGAGDASDAGGGG